MTATTLGRRMTLLAATLSMATLAAPNLAHASSPTAPKTMHIKAIKSEDHLAIIDLIARMNLAVDGEDYAGYANYYTEDGQLDSGFGPVMVGHAAIKGVLEKSAPFITNKRHVASNITLERNGNGITATYYLTVFERVASLTLAGTALVTDEFRYGPKGWKVVRHTTRMDPATLKAMQSAMSAGNR